MHKELYARLYNKVLSSQTQSLRIEYSETQQRPAAAAGRAFVSSGARNLNRLDYYPLPLRTRL